LFFETCGDPTLHFPVCRFGKNEAKLLRLAYLRQAFLRACEDGLAVSHDSESADLARSSAAQRVSNMSSKNATPVVDWMHKRDLPGVMRIEESLHAWEGWSEKQFIVSLREKNIIGMVSKIVDTVGAYVVYELREKEFFFLKFGIAPELRNTRVGHVLVEELKRKARKYKKSLETVFWEGEPVEVFKFFANEGFKSKLKKNFFLSEQPFVPDGIEFFWNLNENTAETSEDEENGPMEEGKWRKK
jgi:hypothetical protein